MFTGIIRGIGRITHVRRGNPWRLAVDAGPLGEALNPGDSLAVSGICLTITGREKPGGALFVDVSRETLERTTCRTWRTGSKVNLELPVVISDMLHGHIVQGHVDDVGRIVRVTGRVERVMVIEPRRAESAVLAEKGSVAVDGVSLTVTRLLPGGRFAVTLIPMTLSETTLGEARAGDDVNLEYDIIGKYVARSLKI